MRKIDITENKFGRLTAIRFSHDKKYPGTKNHLSYWYFKCDCGKEVLSPRNNVVGGYTKSCGCITVERLKTHGFCGTPIYAIWRSILDRCNNSNNLGYKYYGGRGIKCLWNSFEEFRDDMHKDYLKHIKKFGRKNTQINRVDNNSHYCKDNCKWSTRHENMSNRRHRAIISFNGKTQHLKVWAKELNTNYRTLRSRLFQYKWPLDKVLTK